MNYDPIGSRGGINLYAFAGNELLSHFDAMGLICQSCSCRKVLPTPSTNLEIIPNPPGINVMVRFSVPVTIATDGNPAFCKCRYHDGGKSQVILQGKGDQWIFTKLWDQDSAIPCVRFTDAPGTDLANLDPHTHYTLLVDMHMVFTATCMGTDGSIAIGSEPLDATLKAGFTSPAQ
jgi:hypothetical protein